MRQPLALAALASLLLAGTAGAEPLFNRIATFSVPDNLPADRDRSKKTVSEIIAASEDGMLLAYTDAEQKALGLIDITDPANPKPAGFVSLEGESTSVTVLGDKAFVAVVTSGDNFKEPAGHLATVDLKTKQVVATCDLGGQPDSVTLTKDKGKIVIAIENERDEKLNKGALPQLPAGNLTLIGIKDGAIDCASRQIIDVTGLATVEPTDPEPEFVDANQDGLVVVTLQENNHLVIVDSKTGKVVTHFSAGTVDLKNIDKTRDGKISPTEELKGVPREPDAVRWLDNDRFVTANEGDWKGGSRGFTIFRKDGTIEFDSASDVDHLAMRLGHYPERRSAAKGSEPEGIEVATYGNDRLIFVGLERASLVLVYKDEGPGKAPRYLQALPTGIGPEGLLAIPQRDLFVSASETDVGEKGGARSAVMIYRRAEQTAAYPTIQSENENGLPIGWGALSGLAARADEPGKLFSITDSAYTPSRILEIDATAKPARITGAITVTKDGKPASYDLEGIATRSGGGFWLASEGNPEKKDAVLPDLLLRVSAKGEVEEEIRLPEALAKHAVRFGFEGVTVTGTGADETVWLAVQREWQDDPKGKTKILSYKPATREWGVLHYPLSQPAKGHWMGLSELVALGDDRFAVLERDNAFGPKAFKTIQAFSVKGLKPAAIGASEIPTVSKTLLRDLTPDLMKAGGYGLDKVEGMAVDKAGHLFVVTDNDGVEDSSGETQFFAFGKLGN
ncbi:esterase-like activity of phytase family protein [Bosea sp. SSUT16]|uniref:Esterase-like activity of phytase family protein n=1 Tax=Bosea spartocytisi TaxID=2773451 RepID=A0A927E5Z8_9HYPH|nr:esterase-like activity of phytase family protein [Bosea spartocytisi]MBD3845421.1 esterase-like activity of phytase family protein [Bosea spartocytisi]MCT4472590.1 esterase-like activity of phytase family protein [Bosea spartocytisi]